MVPAPQKVKKEKSLPAVDPLIALTNSFQVVSQVGKVFQNFHAEVREHRRSRASALAASPACAKTSLTAPACALLQQLQQAMAMVPAPMSVEQQVSAQKSIEHSLQPPYDLEEHEQLQQKVQELEEWRAAQTQQLRAKDEEALRVAAEYRFEHARLQAQKDAAASAALVADGEKAAHAEVAAVRAHNCHSSAASFFALVAVSSAVVRVFAV